MKLHSRLRIHVKMAKHTNELDQYTRSNEMLGRVLEAQHGEHN